MPELNIPVAVSSNSPTATTVTDSGRAATNNSIVNFSNSSLEYKLKQLRDESMKLSQTLTARLATSQSGQNLLHMGTSLSTLPPDLHQLVTQLHPLITNTEAVEKKHIARLNELIEKLSEIQSTKQRVQYAKRLAFLYHDLTAAETILQKHHQKQQAGTTNRQQTFLLSDDSTRSKKLRNEVEEEEEEEEETELNHENDDLDNAAALERASHITLMLADELQAANEFFTAKNYQQQQNPSKEATEQAQFIVKLGPRIRRLESDTVLCLSKMFENMLYKLQQQNKSNQMDNNSISDAEQKNDIDNNLDHHDGRMQLLLIFGHCMRGMALLGRSRDVESIFARAAILPAVRSRVSVGSLDEGGSRGECKGLTKLLADLTSHIAMTYGPLLSLSESIFAVPYNNHQNQTATTMPPAMEVDLLTAGVWVPIASTLMADNAIKMAIFSPGIASILQANYVALDRFLAQLAKSLLVTDSATTQSQQYRHYYQPVMSTEKVHQAQNRIYAHPKTAEFAKKWNLPIYYQLRFGECCTRLNKAIDETRRQGWIAPDVYTGTTPVESIRSTIGLELGLFMELYDIITGIWKPDVFLRPLTNRFLRGAIQSIGRVVQFISDGMEGVILFGDDETPQQLQEQEQPMSGNNDIPESNGASHDKTQPALAPPNFVTRKPYNWGESEEDIAAVSWELTILDSTIRHDYITIVCNALSSDGSGKESNKENNAEELDELRSLINEVLAEASAQIYPVIEKAWNEHIVRLLIGKCCGPLAAVKGVAATYRMTNRPPPTQASPFVGTILRPLKKFDTEFTNRTPEQIGLKWKQHIVTTVAERYATSVEELIATVQRTEEALKNRKARRVVGPGGTMSDGEKVKLQLFLDYVLFASHVKEIGIEPSTVIGLSKLQELTVEGERLQEQQKPK